METPLEHVHVVLVRARAWICAFAIEDVVETMRALPVQPISNAPVFVRGISIIRGAPLPVVDLASLLGISDGRRGGRFMTVRAGTRQLALEIDDVIGAARVPTRRLEQAPPLLSRALPEHVEKIGVLDGETLVVLEAARLLPEEVWGGLRAHEAR